MPNAPTGRGPGPAKSGESHGYAGRTIAGCVVGERLGRGATSHVFRARHQRLGKDVALKILATDAATSAELRTRFLSEARAIAKLNHENIVKVLDVVEDQGFLCILMELVAGQTLQDKLDDDGALPPRQAFRIAAQVARALEAAHAEKVVHRDVKPANVMLVGAPGDEAVKVVDFGLAEQKELNRVGTPLFMSPEAAQGKRIDEKSDVYALGVCLYRMLTGELPFTGTTVKDILAAHVNEELVPPSTIRPQLGATFDDVLKKLLVKSKGYRPAAGDAAEMLEDVADDLEEREVGVRRVRKRRRRPAARRKKQTNPAVWAGFAVAALVIIGLAIGLSGNGKPAASPTGAGGGGTSPSETLAADPGKKAFDDVTAWVAANPANLAEGVRRLQQVETAYAGTPWARQAGQRRTALESEIAAQKAVEAARPTPKAPVTAKSEDPATKYRRLVEYQSAFRFGDAARLMDEIEEPPPVAGVDYDAWRRKADRLEYLAKHFVDVMDKGLLAARTKVVAKDLFAEAKEGETLVGANSTGAVGLVGGNRHTLEWSKMKLDAFFKPRGVLIDKALSTENYEDVLVIACLAAEFGQPQKTIDRYRQIATGQAGADEMKLTHLRNLFGAGGE
jgi:tRNA A-37 threonylcarbamoyl transferase component Bud32